jgi:hypothetical protein
MTEHSRCNKGAFTMRKFTLASAAAMIGNLIAQTGVATAGPASQPADAVGSSALSSGTWRHASAGEIKDPLACRCYGCTGSGGLFVGKFSRTHVSAYKAAQGQAKPSFNAFAKKT